MMTAAEAKSIFQNWTDAQLATVENMRGVSAVQKKVARDMLASRKKKGN